MEKNDLKGAFQDLREGFRGEVMDDSLSRILYATDASIYREKPVAVCYPACLDDLRLLTQFALKQGYGIIPRAAGTSLAGQVVGDGIVADLSRHFNSVIEISAGERWVRVQPGVVPDELNKILRPYGLLFGPETSTSNRCNLGGMTGNNGCGLHSLVYGSVRDRIIEARVMLSDGSEVLFGPLEMDEYRQKMEMKTMEGFIYRSVNKLLSDPDNRRSIAGGYPDPAVPRRNSGYALDILADSQPFGDDSNKKFNFAKLIAGSEGTLGIITELKLGLDPLPPPLKALSCVHLSQRNDAFSANLIALKYGPQAVEMMDDRILALSEDSPGQKKNRFFLEGKPGALLLVEFCAETQEEITVATSAMEAEMRRSGLGYAFPLVWGADVAKVWNLRKAGLGVLSNMKGDAKPLSLIEDCAVSVEKLGAFVGEVEQMLAAMGKESVYHAHIATGELHIRPVINIKDPGEVMLLRKIAENTAHIVKKYRGSMSGEHGDGRLRGEFIPIVIGERNYELCRKIKQIFDPHNIFNPGKIVSTPPMDVSLRYVPGRTTPEPDTWYDFSSAGGFVRAAEKCNGSGDCRKSVVSGGTMCPSFMAMGDERMTTRARANVIREIFNSDCADPWSSEEVYEMLDNCLSCKGCRSECPSEVDMAKLKSEFLQHRHDSRGTDIRTKLIAHLPDINAFFSFFPALFNFFASNRLTSYVIKRLAGFARERSIPLLAPATLRKWIKRNSSIMNPENARGEICLFIDEFSNHNDVQAGIAVIRLLTSLGYRIITPVHPSSARTYISKGFLRKARRIVDRQTEIFAPLVSADRPLVGIEPSAIAGFRDEFPELASAHLRAAAAAVAQNTFLFEEFIVAEYHKGKITRESFTGEEREVLVHVHCQQKAISSSSLSVEALSIPAGYTVKEIPSGCCGMAGAFGYEKEHFDLSVKIGELVLFPEVRGASSDTVIAAPGTSCRHHIKDGTGRMARHPGEILFEALKENGVKD